MRKHIARLAALSVATFALSSAGPATVSATTVHSIFPRVDRVTRSFGGVAAATLKFRTLDDAADPTFNQLRGINHAGIITGYFGSGAAGHPNRGYTLSPPYAQADYHSENYPGSVQTQVTAINNRAKADTAGFWIDGSGNTFGFIEWNGVFTSYKNPHTTGKVNQLLGLSDIGIAVGFYTDSAGVNHGYALNRSSGEFIDVLPPGGTNVTAAGINRNGDVTGFYTASNGATVGFLRSAGKYVSFSFPGAKATTPLGINHGQTIVGSYTDAGGATHGFVLTSPLGHAQFMKVDDPSGVGTTVVNGINNVGELVGFYVDGAGNTNGFLATP